MTIGTNIARVSLNCDGVSTVFPVALQAYQGTDFLVMLNAGGNETTLTLNNQYSMATAGTAAPPMWALTTSAVYPAGTTLLVILNPQQTQETQYVQGQAFPSAAVQQNIDRLTQMVIRLQDQVNRSIRSPDGDVNPLMLLTPALQRIGTFLTFDQNGNVATGQTLPSGTLSRASIGGLEYPVLAGELGVIDIGFPYGNWRRYGADPLGIVDASIAIQNSFTAGTDSYGPAGTYLSNTTINAPSHVQMYGDGSATILKSTNASAVQIACSGATGVKIHHLQVLNTASAVGPGHPAAIRLQNSTACDVYQVEMVGMWGFGVWNDCSNSCAIMYNHARNFQANPSVGNNFGDIAIYCASSTTAGASYNVIAFNRCYGSANAHGVQLQDPDQATAPTGYPRRNLVMGNIVTQHQSYGILGYFSGAPGGSNPGPCDTFNRIHANHIDGILGNSYPLSPQANSSAGAGIYCVGGGNGGTQVTNNEISNCCINTIDRELAPAAIGMDQVGPGCTPATVTSNTISNMTQGDAVLITTCAAGAEVASNTVNMPSTNNGSGPGGATLVGNGIRVINSSNVDVGPNSVNAYGTGAAVLLSTGGSSMLNTNLTGGNYLALNTNPGSALQTVVDGNNVIEQLNVTGGNYQNAGGSPALLMSGVVGANLTGIIANATGSGPALEIVSSTFVNVVGGRGTSAGVSTVITSGICTGSSIDKSFNWGQGNGASGAAMVNAGTGCSVEAAFTSMPSLGTWGPLDRAVHLGCTVGTAKAWQRVTAGSNNILGTDWISESNL